MGCSTSHPIQPKLLKDPQGLAVDPLQKQGDIIQNIMQDPHIHFFQNKIQSVLQPLRKRKGKLKNTSDIQQFATSDKQQHKRYLQSVNEALKGNSATATNVLSYMINQVADIRQKDQVQGKFKDDAYAALRCFVYLYTGNYTYKKINSQLRRSQYERISTVIGIVKQQLQKYNQQKFARKLKANVKYGKFIDLYRGVPKPDKLMSKGKKLYWKGFTSTSLERRVANNFGRYHYVIELDKDKPHDYMIIPQELSQYDEEQVILFPYFFFQCLSVQDFTSGANYILKQCVVT